MTTNRLDAVAAAYIAYGAWRGRKRGLADEAYRLLRLAIAALAGCGLYRVVGGLISNALSVGAGVSGPIGFAGTVAVTWSILRRVKQSLTSWIAARFAAHASVGGAIAGAARSLLLALVVVVAMHLAGKGGHSGSWIGRLAELILTRQ